MTIQEKSLEHLFVSKVRVKAITYFMFNLSSPIHLRGAVRELKEEINAVRRELMRLESMNLLIAETKGNRRYFQTNTRHPFFEELVKIVHKSYGLGGEIVKNQNRLGQVNFALLSSSFTKNVYHGDQVIDLFLVGNVDMKILEEVVGEFEKKEGKEVRYAVLKPSEFEVRRRRRDTFIMDLLLQETVMLVGLRDDMVRGNIK